MSFARWGLYIEGLGGTLAPGSAPVGFFPAGFFPGTLLSGILGTFRGSFPGTCHGFIPQVFLITTTAL